MTKDQYDTLQQNKSVLNLFEKTGVYVGGDAPYYIYAQITGEKVNTSCPNCKGEALINILRLIKEYEASL